jgi:hypothetical protein
LADVALAAIASGATVWGASRGSGLAGMVGVQRSMTSGKELSSGARSMFAFAL